MQISLHDTGKRYNREWIFRHVSLQFAPGIAYAITGPNGSGKSTLLQVIAGAIQHNEGKIDYYAGPDEQSKVSADLVYHNIAIAAPYLDLVEEMTALEFLAFHAGFKKLTQDHGSILSETGLSKAANKQIRYFSSGMKQRLKLAQAFFSDASVLLLDEPTSNLDEEGCNLYHHLLSRMAGGKLVIISSNDPEEYRICQEVIPITRYKVND
jgi:ABC-type multidrug transport system ATPase subunit